MAILSRLQAILGQLIAARALQGVGGAMMSPQPMTIITSIFPPERRPTWPSTGA
jgi:MFS family permease